LRRCLYFSIDKLWSVGKIYWSWDLATFLRQLGEKEGRMRELVLWDLAIHCESRPFLHESVPFMLVLTFQNYKQGAVNMETRPLPASLILVKAVGCVHLLYNDSWKAISSQMNSSCLHGQAVRPVHHSTNHTCRVNLRQLS
jgi:hypothetical protein